MNKQVIVYIHGFNSGPGDKLEYLRREVPDFEVVGIQLNNKSAIEDFTDIVNLISKYESYSIHVVGTSLGAFYSFLVRNNSVLKNIDDIHYYLINISTSPNITLKKLVGQNLKNYKTNKTTHINNEFVEELGELKEKYMTFDKLYNVNFFLGMNDDVVDFNELLHNLHITKEPYNLIWVDEDHRFKNIEPIINSIKDNINIKI